MTTTVTHSTTPPAQGLPSIGRARTSKTTTNQGSDTSHNTSTGTISSTQSGTPSLQQDSAAAAAAATSPRYVPGARIESGSETSSTRIAEVLHDLPTSNPPTGGGGASEEGKENDEQAQTGTTQAPTTSTESPTPTESPSPNAEIVLSEDCGSAPCGYIQELRHESALHPDDAAQAADAMAKLFTDSRAKIVDHKLYPIGVAVSFTLKLDGWAHRRATLKWSLWSEGDGQEELPKSWWRDVRIARITPTTNRETLFGEFWVPIPRGHGDYAVHLTLDDAKGVAHAGGKSSPIH